MSVSVEIEVEPKDKCEHCGADMKSEAKAPTKDEMLAELKKLLAITAENGRAERQAKIDELIKTINEAGSED